MSAMTVVSWIGAVLLGGIAILILVAVVALIAAIIKALIEICAQQDK